jgi:hypothetical protein
MYTIIVHSIDDFILQMLDEPLGSDVFREMRAKEDRFKMDASFWTAHPHCRQIVLTWMQEVH